LLVGARQVGDLKNSDFVMNHVFWVGVYPGLTDEMLNYMVATFHQLVMELKAAGKS
jgi:CDP-6-deoxy-D-xylo-4-hexulose-3-dehydrase